MVPADIVVVLDLVLVWNGFDAPELLTFFKDMLKVRHALNICTGDIFVLPKNRLDFGAKFLEHRRVSHKKTATCSA